MNLQQEIERLLVVLILIGLTQLTFFFTIISSQRTISAQLHEILEMPRIRNYKKEYSLMLKNENPVLFHTLYKK
jgi:hypothetical protein